MSNIMNQSVHIVHVYEDCGINHGVTEEVLETPLFMSIRFRADIESLKKVGTKNGKNAPE